MIKVEHLYKNYSEDIKVLKDINFTFEDGKTYAIIGSSGGGKSTFIRCLNMLEEPTAGKVIMDDVVVNDPKTNLAKVREKMGMVFQNFNLFEHMTARKNVAYALIKVKKMKQDEADKKAVQLLNDVGMGHRVDSYPHQLSGGEKQRVAIARALAMEPEVLLCDEPTSALDVAVQRQVVQEMLHVRELFGTAIIIVTHDIGVVSAMADTVLVLKDGNKMEYGPAKEVLEHPQNIYTKELLSAVPKLRRSQN